MRRLMKFLHTLGAIGLMGAVACLLVLASMAPSPSADLAGYGATRVAMAAIATWILLPSLTLVAGLLAIAVNPAYQNAGWAWLKLATGILVFEGGLGIQGAMRDGAERGAAALAGRGDVSALAGSIAPERLSLSSNSHSGRIGGVIPAEAPGSMLGKG